jgi:hypothetical protein
MKLYQEVLGNEILKSRIFDTERKKVGMAALRRTASALMNRTVPQLVLIITL